ncbi:mitochondrial carrier [Xylona heveae TC161]|uniref:Mitochondrial carrier n=1 Tax=Xylona heveae (strain CBS 132557 / TC161) TaxID=1328760 RepID=A0A164ZPF0_XYLHT|nr:mitochondrial carrier [Xylona heveae TC161]KZF19342.1 mitochondrial carrier [Xylona heveae TC161]
MASPSGNVTIESPFARALVAGGIAGTTVDLSLFPIDTLKTRLQSSKGFAASGGFRGVYRGVGSAVVGSAPGAALFFVTYETSKRLLKQAREADENLAGGAGLGTLKTWAGPVEHMISASLGEVAACAVRVPTEVIKQRAQAVQHPSSLEALKHILTQRSSIGLGGVWRELYRGWNVTVMREVPFTVIQFPLWEGMKEAWRQRNRTGLEDDVPASLGTLGRTRPDEAVSAAASGVFGSIAGAVAAGVTTPLDVLKTRLMLSTARRQKVWPMVTQIMRESGPRAFFAGIGPRVFWISAGGAIFLGSYQWAYNTFGGQTGRRH